MTEPTSAAHHTDAGATWWRCSCGKGSTISASPATVRASADRHLRAVEKRGRRPGPKPWRQP